MGKPNRQTVLLLAAGILAVVFSLGFFAGRNTVTYEVAAQTERTASQAAQTASSPEKEAQTNAEGRTGKQTERQSRIRSISTPRRSRN